MMDGKKAIEIINKECEGTLLLLYVRDGFTEALTTATQALCELQQYRETEIKSSRELVWEREE